MTEKKTVEQLKTEYAALTVEAREIDERLAELQPALAEHERLEARLSQITGPGRNLITNARLALKEALFEREMGGTDKPVIAEPDPMSTIGVSQMHITGTIEMCKQIQGLSEWLTPNVNIPERAEDTRLTGPKLVIDETGKGYWR